MIQDLIDLYYYIRSSDDIRDLELYKYQDHKGLHVMHPTVTWNATYTEHNWEFKITAGSTLTYRQIFLSKMRWKWFIEVYTFMLFRFLPLLLKKNQMC